VIDRHFVAKSLCQLTGFDEPGWFSHAYSPFARNRSSGRYGPSMPAVT
jgi:hypothetical protein